MDDRQRRENERNIRSNDFLTANLADFAQNEVAKAKIAYLTEKVNTTQTQYQKQISSGSDLRQDYSLLKDAYDELLDAMRDIKDFANAMADETPGLEDKFRLPRGGGKRGLVAAARVFADDALAYKQTFMDYGMDANFITRLRTTADALEEALAAADASAGDRVGATGTLEQEIKEASRMVEILDPIVRRTYRTNPAKLATWISASHVERRTPKPKTTVQV